MRVILDHLTHRAAVKMRVMTEIGKHFVEYEMRNKCNYKYFIFLACLFVCLLHHKEGTADRRGKGAK